MARTPLANAVEEAVAKIADEEARTTRRAAPGGRRLGARRRVAARRLRPARPAAGGSPRPRIAVVGAGLAGLTAPTACSRPAYAPTVYEASDRIGGRCWTGRGDFADGQIYEHGGELIDIGPHRAPHLAQELGLTLDNLLKAETKGTEQLGYFFGKPYTFDADDRRLAPVFWQQMHAGRQRRGLSDALQLVHAARLRARPHVGLRLHRALRAGRAPLAARRAARRRLQHRVRRRDDRAELAEPALPDRLLGARPVPRSSASPTRSSTSAAATTRSRRFSPRSSDRRSRRTRR